jgi:type VI secretion system VgrG family protein
VALVTRLPGPSNVWHSDAVDPVHVELWCPHGPEIAWQVISASGREALSSPYEFEIELWCEDAGADIEAALGADAELLFERGGITRAVYGVITEVQVDVPPVGMPEHEGVGARVTLAPAYKLLEQQIDTRFHAGRSVIEILREHLGSALAAFGRKLDVESRISGSYNSRDYCVQFRESTFDFCNRLMEEEGIAYMFVPDADEQREVMVLVDDNSAYAAAELLVSEPIPVVTHAPEELARETIQRLDWRSRRTPNRVITRGHNYKQPARDDEGEAEQVEHPDVVREQYVDGERRQIIDDPVGDPDAKTFTGAELPQRTTQARLLLEQRRRDAALGRGRSNALGFAPGTTFELADAPRRIDGASELLLTEVTHTAKRDDGDAFAYANTFTCMPRSRPYRPTQRTAAPRVFGVQTGVVVGRGDDEIHTDALGRVRVRFHGDRHADDEHRSCWIRVAQAWAGLGYGSMVIPRVGMEVVVSFVDGNPDCPLITGCVYDGVNTPPRPLPAEMSRSTFKTSSTPGGEGHNELMIEDAEGREQIFVHAQGRMDMRVRGSLYETAGSNREVVVGSRDRLQGDYNLSIGNDINVSSGGNRYSRIETDTFQHTRYLHETSERRHIHVSTAASIDAESLAVEATKLVSTKANEIVQAGSSTLTLKAGEQLILESNNLIGLKVGDSFISIGIDGVDIGGSMIRINSGGHVSGKAADGVACEPFLMVKPINALTADDGKPGGGGGGGGGGRSHEIETVTPHHAPPMVPPKKLPSKKSSRDRPASQRDPRDREIVAVAWSKHDVWCSEEVFVRTEFDKPGDPCLGTISIIDHDDGSLLSEDLHELGGAQMFNVPKVLCDICPREAFDHKEASRSFFAMVDGVRSMDWVNLRFLSSAPHLRFTEGFARFDVWVEDHVVKIGGVIDYTRGWLRHMIYMGLSGPAHTGGMFPQKYDGLRGWRHCKVDPTAGGKESLVYHDGKAWIPVPETWQNPLDTRLHGNGIWKEDGELEMQYGNGVPWPDPLPPWSVGPAELNARLERFRQDVQKLWSKFFNIKRQDCLSNAEGCCEYEVEFEISFREVAYKSKHGIILADAERGVRANASAWPFDAAPRTIQHEFGHHLGLPDEYPGASSVDPTVYGDGATAGIDKGAIMGAGSAVRRRHLETICQALGQLVEREFGKHFDYIPMEKAKQ